MQKVSNNQRLCIYPADLQRIMGKSYKQSFLYLRKLKLALGKKEHQAVSVKDFCQYSGLPYEDVIVFIVG